MKKIISLFLTVVLLLALTACGGKNTVKCNVFTLNGPTGVGIVSLMDKNEDGKTKLDYNFKTVTTNDEIVGKIMNGEADIAAVATNIASAIYNKTQGKISVLAINTLGVLNLVTKDKNIKTLADLKGKTIYSTGQGANPEFIIKYLLEQNNLKVGTDVKIVFVNSPEALVVKAIKEGSPVIAPQPVATSITLQDNDAKIAINLNDEWEKVSDTALVMGCIIARNEFIEKNPDAVKTFLKEYKNSIEKVNKDPETAGALCEKYGIIAKSAIATKAIPYCNIVYQDGNELKTNLSAYLEFLFDKKPVIIGGALPTDDFYYNGK